MTKIMAKGLASVLLATMIFTFATGYSLAGVDASAEAQHQALSQNEVLTLAEGKESSFIVTGDGVLWSKGRNEQGQLGTGDFEKREEFQAVLEDIVYVSAGYEHTAAVKSDGRLFLWGNNEEGQLGTGKSGNSATAQLVLEKIKQVSAGGFHTLAVEIDGTLWAWGSNASGALGNGNTSTAYTPVKIMSDVQEAGAGWYFSAALKEDGTLWTWGWNEKGRLGKGDTKDSKTPVKIMEDVTTIAIGPSHGLALKKDGSLWAWGDNGYGQLGDGTKENRYEPVLVMENVREISGGYYSSAAVKGDGSLWTWGTNKGLWLGNEAKEGSSIPVKVKNSVRLFSLGRAGSLVVTEDGRIYLDSLNDNSVANIQEGRPVILKENLTVLQHNQKVYGNKRHDEQALLHYLKATEAIQSDSTEIQTLAAEITIEAVTDMEKLTAIHDWVCKTLYYNYDAYYNGANKGDVSALGALREESTVCSGYSNLMAALLRASGIPAKYISGYATSAGKDEMTVEEISQSRNAHAWNEVWINSRWVIVDSTWDSRNRYQDGKTTGLPFSREYLDPKLENFSYNHMIKEYTEFMIST